MQHLGLRSMLTLCCPWCLCIDTSREGTNCFLFQMWPQAHNISTSRFPCPLKGHKMWTFPVLYFPWSLFLILLRFRVYATFQKSHTHKQKLYISLFFWALWKKLKFTTRMFSILFTSFCYPFWGGDKFPQAM